MYSLREIAISHLSSGSYHLGLVITTEDAADSGKESEEDSSDSETAVAHKGQPHLIYTNTPCSPQEPHWQCDFAGKIAL